MLLTKSILTIDDGVLASTARIRELVEIVKTINSHLKSISSDTYSDAERLEARQARKRAASEELQGHPRKRERNTALEVSELYYSPPSLTSVASNSTLLVPGVDPCRKPPRRLGIVESGRVVAEADRFRTQCRDVSGRVCIRELARAPPAPCYARAFWDDLAAPLMSPSFWPAALPASLSK